MAFTARIIPNATSGTTTNKIFLFASLTLKTAMEPAHLPIIKLPQYIEINGATSED
jgi:hypothetical protein